MTMFQLAQFALGLLALGLIVWRGQRLWQQSAIDGRLFAAALRAELSAGHRQRALAAASALCPAAAAELASAALVEIEAGGNARMVLEETHVALRHSLARGRDEVVLLGRMASPLALIGVILDLAPTLGAAPNSNVWERSVMWSDMLSRATLTFALGFATLLVCAAGTSVIQRGARRVEHDLDRILAAFDLSEGGGGSGAM
jgi:hypothetical protein